MDMTPRRAKSITSHVFMMRANGMSVMAIARALCVREADVRDLLDLPTPNNAPQRLTREQRQEAFLADAVDSGDNGWGFPLSGGDFVRTHSGVTVSQILDAVAVASKIGVGHLTGERRSRRYARPRQAAYLLAKELTGFSLPNIGRAIGGRDHTTIMDGIKKAERLRQTNGEFRVIYNRARQILGV